MYISVAQNKNLFCLSSSKAKFVAIDLYSMSLQQDFIINF